MELSIKFQPTQAGRDESWRDCPQHLGAEEGEKMQDIVIFVIFLQPPKMIEEL